MPPDPGVSWVSRQEEVQEVDGNGNGQAATKTHEGNGHAGGTLTAENFERLFGTDAYHDVEILGDGTVRERPRSGDGRDEAATRTLKTGRTWY